jgi:threonine dehydratase
VVSLATDNRVKAPCAPTAAEIAAAAERIRPHARRTPLLRLSMLDDRAGGPVYAKLETLQEGGSFKVRGALNAAMQASMPGRGLVAYSSGNHAIAVALAARVTGTDAVLVVPSDIPNVKLHRIVEAGGRTVPYDRNRDDRTRIAERIGQDEGRRLIPSFDDIDVVMGQATVAAEILADLAAAGHSDAVIVAPCGGGGLVAGSCMTACCSAMSSRVVAAEPAGFAIVGRMVSTGQRRANPPAPPTICDALMAAWPTRLIELLPRAHRPSGVIATDDAVRRAVAFAHLKLGLDVEPSGAIGLATVLSGDIRADGAAVAVILSGGNIEPATLGDCIAASLAEERLP